MNLESFKGEIVEESSKKKPLFEAGTPPTVPKSEKKLTLDIPKMPDELNDILKPKTEQREAIDSFVSSIKDLWSGGVKPETKEDREARE